MPVTAVSAPSRLGADVGARIADAGGNAVDVAVGSTIVGMVTDPGIIGPGAGCFLTIWPADASPVVVDGYVAMPGLGNPPPAGATLGTPVTMAYGGGMETLVGPASVAVPGAWAALGVACERFGSLAWREILAPAVEVAERGFPLSEGFIVFAVLDARITGHRTINRMNARIWNRSAGTRRTIARFV